VGEGGRQLPLWKDTACFEDPKNLRKSEAKGGGEYQATKKNHVCPGSLAWARTFKEFPGKRRFWKSSYQRKKLFHHLVDDKWIELSEETGVTSK